MNFGIFNCWKYFFHRNVFLDKESINSIVVHDGAEDPFQQLLVATDVSVTAAGND